MFMVNSMEMTVSFFALGPLSVIVLYVYSRRDGHLPAIVLYVSIRRDRHLAAIVLYV